MKKLTTLLSVIFMSLVMTACGGGGGDSTSDSRDNVTSTADQLLLSWVAPTTRADGTPLTLSDLEGYRIYYGTSASDLDMLVDLNDNSITDYTITGLPSGSYYFSVTAYDSSGAESGFSNTISKDV